MKHWCSFNFFLCAIDHRRIRSIRVLGLTSLYGAVFIGTKKILMAHPRPWWVNNEIGAVGCDKDYGRPSGHSEYSIFCYLMLYRELFVRPSRKQRPRLEGTTRSTSRVFFRNAMIIVTLTIGLSRFLLGVHSIDQVIGGYSWGYLSFAMYVRYFENFFDDLFHAIFEGEWKLNPGYYILICVAYECDSGLHPSSRLQIQAS